MKLPRCVLAVLAFGALGVSGFEPSAATFAHVTSNPGHAFHSALDWTAPTVSLSDPGANLRGSITLNATASDADSGVQKVVIERSPANANTWTEICTDTTSSYSCGLDTTTVADGLYDFRAVATDNAANDTTSTVTEDRRIDNTAPAGSLADPGANMSGSKSMNASASDGGSGVALVKIQRSVAGMNTWIDICSLSSGPYTCTLDTLMVTDGLFDFRTVTTDNAGNVTNSAVVANRRVDNTPPISIMTDPGQYLRGNAIPLAATATDVGGSGVKQVAIQRAPANGSTWTDVCIDTTAAYTCTLDSTTVATPDGLYDFRAVATDNADNVTTSTVVEDRRIDNTAPVAAMTSTTSPRMGTAALGATATDAGSGVASVTIQRAPANGNTWTNVCTATGTSPYSCTPSATIPNGTYDLRAIGTDNAGNVQTVATLAEDIVVDNTPPTAMAIASTNGGGSTQGRMQTNDTLTYTFSEAMAPASIWTGWNGSSQAVRFRLVNNGTSDQIQIQTTSGGTINLGTITTNRNFTGTTQNINANMELRNNGTEVRITLTGSATTPSTATAGNMSWASSTAPTDLAGNAATGNTRAETDNDIDF